MKLVVTRIGLPAVIKPDKKCHPDCGATDYTQPWKVYIDGKFSHSCKDSWGMFSCPLSPANRKGDEVLGKKKKCTCKK